MMTARFEKREQVAFVPVAAKDNPRHPSCEYGVVVDDPGKDLVAVRFWAAGQIGRRLRPVRQFTRRQRLVRFESVAQSLIEKMLGK